MCRPSAGGVSIKQYSKQYIIQYNSVFSFFTQRDVVLPAARFERKPKSSDFSSEASRLELSVPYSRNEISSMCRLKVGHLT